MDYRHICALILYYNHVISRLFQKWCSSGVVSALPCCESIDFTGFSGIFQDTAVADESIFIMFVFPLLR